MSRELLHDCLPYFLALAASLAVLRLLIGLSGAKFQPARLKHLLRDERGAVQSLSFVLTVPLFILIMMFIVQLTQITIARMYVEYAAYAATRSAIVWFPANTDWPAYGTNHLGGWRSPFNSNQFEVSPSGAKYRHVHLAAAMACMPICPSRAQRVPPPPADLITSLYGAYEAATEAGRPQRRRVLQNKMAYALEHTHVSFKLEHPDVPLEPPLHWQWIWYGDWWYWNWWRYSEFWHDEIGWRDAISVTVTHDYALLPGPGRWLLRRTGPTDNVAANTSRSRNTYTYRLSATMTMQNEGLKSTRRYWQEW
jgi:hypothetical protein